jgi:hypothetical protein
MEGTPDPGGGVPQVSHNVTISISQDDTDHERNMDTDATDNSVSSTKNRKRIRPSKKVCRHCNKKRRHSKNSKSLNIDTDCICGDVSINKVQHDTLQSSSTTTLQITSSPASQPSNHVHRKIYNESDCSPYIVHVQKQQLAPNDGTSVHPVSFGNFLKKQSYKNIINGSVKKVGRNRLTISFNNFTNANEFINDTKLADFHYNAFIPSFNVIRMGIVKGVPNEWTEEEIQENINVPVGCGNVLKIRRLNYKVMVDGSPVWKPSQTIVITFDGQILPKRIFMCYNALPVDLYVYPTVQCFNCCRYGHTQTQCRSKPRCYKCGQNHPGSTCTVEEDCVTCCLCSGMHFAISKYCPEFERQKCIKLSMAQNCVSYAEASKMHPPVSKPYADVVATPPTLSPTKTHNVQQSESHSYKKTVFLKPRSIPKTQQGYDKFTHNVLTKDYNMPTSSGNGCAFPENTNVNNPSIQELILQLIKLLSSSNILPNNVAEVITFISKIFNINNGSQKQAASVELP